MDELILDINVPMQVTPASDQTYTIQNTMKTDDDMLLVSTHGDLAKPWTEVEPRASVQFSDPMYLMQKSWAQWVFPVIAHTV